MIQTYPISRARRRQIRRWALLYRVPEGCWGQTIRQSLQRSGGFYLTPFEIVWHLRETLSADDISHILSLDSTDIFALHRSLGQYIRYSYGLWHPANPHTVLDGTDLQITDGVITDIRFPDNLSYIILKTLRWRLQVAESKRVIERRNPPREQA